MQDLLSCAVQPDDRSTVAASRSACLVLLVEQSIARSYRFPVSYSATLVRFADEVLPGPLLIHSARF